MEQAMRYANNPNYEMLFEHGQYKVYTPKVITEYHKSREVEATIQNIYSNAGATAEFIKALCKQGLEMINRDKNNETLRTNMTAILNNLLYRTDYPIDALCGLRMGAILTYLEYGTESEPAIIEYGWLNKKMQLAHEIPALYDFFLRWGIANTEAYLSHLNTLNVVDYFAHRTEMINSFGQLPQS